MGDMAELYDELPFDDDDEGVKCKYCGTNPLYWENSQLVNASGRVHVCKAFALTRTADADEFPLEN